VSLHRDIFFMHNGPGPWSCHFCAEPILVQDLTRRYGPVVHHIDENHGNNDPGNLSLAHFGCHCGYHNRPGYRHTPEAKAAISAKISASKLGKKLSARHRKALKEAAYRRVAREREMTI
jgi:hypothetical protein